jgi:hypothetical protein
MDAPLDLHLAAITRVLANFLCMQSLSDDEARMWIRRLAIVHSGPAEQHLIDELERVTGMTIAELAELTKKWLSKG